MGLDKRSEAQKQFDEIILARVRQGMALLEEKYGPGWVDFFDTDDLQNMRLEEGACCVLGTIGNKRNNPGYDRDEWSDIEYDEGLNQLGIGYAEAVEHGFTLNSEAPGEQEWDESGDHGSWNRLTEVWRDAITVRKALR